MFFPGGTLMCRFVAPLQGAENNSALEFYEHCVPNGTQSLHENRGRLNDASLPQGDRSHDPGPA